MSNYCTLSQGKFWILQNNDGLFFEKLSPTGRACFTSDFGNAYKFFYLSSEDLNEVVLLGNKLGCKQLAFTYIGDSKHCKTEIEQDLMKKLVLKKYNKDKKPIEEIAAFLDISVSDISNIISNNTEENALYGELNTLNLL